MRKTLSILLCLLLLFASSSTALAAPANGYGNHGVNKGLKLKFAIQLEKMLAGNEYVQFADAEHHWAKKSIGLLYASGLFNGYPDGKFRPDQSITQAESIALLMRLVDNEDEDIDEDNDADNDRNVPAWAKSSLKKASHKGIINLNRFHSAVQANRAQVAVWIAIALKLEPADTEDLPFKDGLLISREDAGYILALYKEGYMIGTPDGKFNPNSFITRAEMAAILERILEDEYYDNDYFSMKKTVTLEQGEDFDLGATIDWYNNADADDYDLTWRSSNINLARVDEDGVVTASASRTGTVYITVKAINEDDEDNTFPATCKVTVVRKAASISIQKTAILEQGEKLDLGDTLVWDDDLDAEDYDLSWESSKTAIAAVNQNGIVTASEDITGTVTITVTATHEEDEDDTFYATCKVTVVEEFGSADLESTGNFRIQNNKLYEGYKLVYDDEVVDLDEADKITLTQDNKSPVNLNPVSDTLWFKVQKESTTYVLKVYMDNVTYEAVLEWDEPEEIDTDNTGDEKFEGIDYEKYAFEDLDISEVDYIFQIDPDGDASKITSTTDYLRFKASNPDGDYVYFILDGDNWYTATIVYED